VDGLVRDAWISLTGHLPVIGSLCIVAAFALFGAYKAKDDDTYKSWTPVLVVAGVAALLVAFFNLGQAEAVCKDWYSSNYAKYQSANCDVIVHCNASNGYTCRDTSK